MSLSHGVRLCTGRFTTVVSCTYALLNIPDVCEVDVDLFNPAVC